MKKLPFLLLPFLASVAFAEPASNQDPYKTSSSEEEGKASEESLDPTYSICFEAFSLPLKQMAQLSRESLEAAKLYQQIVSDIDDTTVKQEFLHILKSTEKLKTTSESISETIYPTEYQPYRMTVSESKQTSSPSGKSAASTSRTTQEYLTRADSVPPVIPTSYETRNLGQSIEMMGSEHLGKLDLTCAIEQITAAGHSHWGSGVSETKMPEFETQRYNFQATIPFGQPALLGTLNRPPISKIDPDSSNRVWLVFATATKN